MKRIQAVLLCCLIILGLALIMGMVLPTTAQDNATISSRRVTDHPKAATLAEDAWSKSTACLPVTVGGHICNSENTPAFMGFGSIPIIEVTPDSLTSTQATNVQLTQTLMVQNIGSSDLIWTVFETTSSLVDPIARPLALTQLDSRALQAGQVVNRPARLGATAVAPNLIPLYDQTDNPANTSFASQHFPDLGAAVQGADDFVVPAHEQWHIEQVFAEGLYSMNDGPAPTWIVQFYADGGGLPGTLIANQTDITATSDITGIVTLDLTTPVILPPGIYWVSVFADMAYNPGINEQWFWRVRAVQSGQPYHWQDPSDLIPSANCPTWMPVCDGTSPANSDALFALMGTIDILPCDTLDAISWVTVSPLSGTTAAGSSTPITVVFDSTGLANGTYTGILCIDSNDMLEPQLPISLTLNVVTPNYAVALSGTPNLSGTPGTTVSTTLWLTNTGKLTDTYNLTTSGLWTNATSLITPTLASGEGVTLTVSVTIPADAANNALDNTTVLASGMASDSLVLTTTAVAPTLYLPFVAKN